MIINTRPKKKKALPWILELREKKATAFLKPTRATTPIRKEIQRDRMKAKCSYIAYGEHGSIEEEEDAENIDKEAKDYKADADCQNRGQQVRVEYIQSLRRTQLF